MTKKSLHAGNAAKMREALQHIANMAERIDYRIRRSEETLFALRYERHLVHNILECARAALASPTHKGETK